jgi:aldehyde dehydrogenase (NAD+)
MSSSAGKNFGLFINGKERPAASRATFVVENPADGSIVAQAARGDAEDAELAVQAARAAFPRWANLPAAERERLLLKAADVFEQQQDRFIDLLIDESGSTITKARYEINYTPQLLRAAAGEARRLYGETMPHDRPTCLSFVIREPVGVVLAIVPFNAPLALLVKMIAFPLAAGNTVIAKPSEETPLVAVEFAKLLSEAGWPAGVFNVVTGYGHECGAALVNHAGINGVALTGSTATGQKVGAAAISRMRAMQLELGGKNPLIVLGDVDPIEAAATAAEGIFYHAGQICMANARVLVERSIAEPFAAALVSKAESLKLGDVRDETTAYGPLINAAALQKVEQHVANAVSAGAKLLTGGSAHHGLVYRPTVLWNPPLDCAAWCEETFGPVVSVVPVDNLQEAIALANASEYGLSAAILTRDVQQAFTAARQLRCGSVHIGMHSFQSNALAPIGGYGLSGIGRSGGSYSIEAFTEQKWISIEIGTPPIANQ